MNSVVILNLHADDVDLFSRVPPTKTIQKKIDILTKPIRITL
jgi:hypothetical protein